MTGGLGPAIRTPDQRIRVFVSSTLRELADERRAVRDGDRADAARPGDVRARRARPTLRASSTARTSRRATSSSASTRDSYGWVAPDEEISGLEDEYNLAPPSMPKLIYIKESDHREERLTQLITRIRSDDTAAYLPFHDADELADRVVSDLATLLAERFDESRPETASGGRGAVGIPRRPRSRRLHDHDRP